MFLHIYNVEFHVMWILPQLQKKRLDQVKQKNHESKKIHEKLQRWWGEKGEKEKQGQQPSEVAWQLPPNTVQGTPTYELTHTLVLPQFQWGHRRVYFEMLSLSQGLWRLCLWSTHGSLNKFSGSWPILKTHNITKWNRNDRLLHVMGVCTVWYDFSVQTM